jgi:hypothetical protein
MQTQGLEPAKSDREGASLVMDDPGEAKPKEHDRMWSFDGEGGGKT